MIYKERLKEWLDQIYETVERDISCRELVDRLPAYVDAIVQNRNPNGEFADLQGHLAGCLVCSGLFEELVHVAALEENGRLPQIEQLLADFASLEAVEPEERVAVPTV